MDNISLQCNKVHLAAKPQFIGGYNASKTALKSDDNDNTSFHHGNVYISAYHDNAIKETDAQPISDHKVDYGNNTAIASHHVQGKALNTSNIIKNVIKADTSVSSKDHLEFPYDEQKDIIKTEMPAIITAANTNKPIKLEHRERNGSKTEKRKINGKSKKDLLNKPVTVNNAEHKVSIRVENNNRLYAPSCVHIGAGHSLTDIGASLANRLKSFARMDVEFYNIINKMGEANEKRNLVTVINDESITTESVNVYENVYDQEDENVSQTDLDEPICDSPPDKEMFKKESSYGLKLEVKLKPDLPVKLDRDDSHVSILSEEIAPDVKLNQNTIADVHDSSFNGERIHNGTKIQSTTPRRNYQMFVSGNGFMKGRSKEIVNPVYDDNDKQSRSNEISDYNGTSSPLHSYPTNTALDINEALRIMQLPIDVSNADILHISARRIPMENMLDLTSMDRETNMTSQTLYNNSNTVHQFCTSYGQGGLGLDSKMASRYSHAPSQYDVLKPKPVAEVCKFDVSNTTTTDVDTLTPLLKDKNEEVMSLNEEDQRISEIALRMMEVIKKSEDNGYRKIMKVKHFVDQVIEPVENFDSTVTGQKLEMKDDKSRYFDTLYPPKFNITPQTVVDTLAPQYVSVLENENDISEECIEEEIRDDIEDGVVYEGMTADEKEYKERIVNRKHNSNMEINEYDNLKETFGDESLNLDRFVSVLDIRRKSKKVRPCSSLSSLEFKDDKPWFKKSMSQPIMKLRKSVENPILSDYNSIMNETTAQCAQLKILKSDPQKLENTIDYELTKNIVGKEDVLYKNVQVLSRSRSTEEIFIDHRGDRLHKSFSENDMTQLFKDLTERYKSVKSDYKDWMREEFWYKWFDELFPPNDVDEVSLSRESLNSSNVSDGLSCQIEVLPKRDSRAYCLIQREIGMLNNSIDKISPSSGLLGFHLCRRGAYYRKIGEIKNALGDLTRAIELEPRLSDAYWHRHLVYLIQGNTRKALEDLTRITMYNPNHTGAHRSRAEIYKQKGESNFAISSYNQAISSDPKNSELYYARAELLEQRGELLLAIDDYRSADMYEPENTSAIRKIGLYHFDNGLWTMAVNDFTDLLRRQSKNADAYMYRARALANLGKFSEAIRDLSVSITLQPDNFLSFYYRGCYLRKCMPKQALQDLSTSLLLDSTELNVNSFLHRGILYMEMKRFDQATCDFQLAVRLNPKLAAAHVNLGIIEMIHNNNLYLAVKRFNVALRMDPTYIRAIICRAEASENVNNIDGAILDYTRAIHMKPDNIELRMTRGRLLLKKNRLDLASFHIRQCAVMNDGKNSSPTQIAAVETFLKNYDNAINVLEIAVKSQPIVHLFGLLGRTRMKAKQFKDAINDFNQALNLLQPWDTRVSWPKESAEIFFLIGVCHMELQEYKSALDSFNISLKTNPAFAEGYFRRGLVKMKLGISKGVNDFNKALAYQPQFYQAYLGRAAYYGKSKRYAKAIMNCNEAIKIEKESIRAYLYRGAIKFNIKAYSLAIKDLSQAIERDCTCSLAYFNRAVCFHEKKYYFHALKDYSIVLMLDSNLHMHVLLNRGLLYFQIGDMENAIHDFVLALETDTNNPHLHHTLGLCYHKLGHLQKAVESYTNTLKVDPFFCDALIGRGNVLMDYNQKLGHLLGKRDYIRAMHMNPLCMEARVNLAYSLQVECAYKKAWDMFTRTIEINLEYTTALEGRALVNLQMGNTFGAFVDMNNAILKSRTAESLTLRGVTNQFLGDRMSAMNDFQAAKKLDPTYSLAYYNSANLYFLHRQLSQAISNYTKAIDWNPNDAAAILNRAVAKCLIKDYDGASVDFSLAEKLAPHWSLIYSNRGYLNYLKENYQLAQDDYTRALILSSNDPLLYKKRADACGKCGNNDMALIDYRRAINLQMLKKKDIR